MTWKISAALFGPPAPPFDLLVASLCPSIMGNDLVRPDSCSLSSVDHLRAARKNRVPVRGDLHTLVVGDPGLGKSKCWAAASVLAGRLVRHDDTTGSQTMVRDPVSKDLLSRCAGAR